MLGVDRLRHRERLAFFDVVGREYLSEGADRTVR